MHNRSLKTSLVIAAITVALGDRSLAADEGTRLGGSMILATTTSTQDSGLLGALVPEFSAHTGIEVKVIAVGSGAALEMGGKGDADALLVHAPTAEAKYVASGDLIDRRLVMHNDFVLLGPRDDPAHVKQAGDVDHAMAAIARGGGFVSRGDDSGTHKMELALWQAAGIDPASIARREETGQGMGATLNIADQRNAYTLADRGTYLVFRPRLELEVVFEGDARLLNVYHAYVVNPAKHPGVKQAQARALVDFLVAPTTQALIESFGKQQYGRPLFVADAGKDERRLLEVNAAAKPDGASALHGRARSQRK